MLVTSTFTSKIHRAYTRGLNALKLVRAWQLAPTHGTQHVMLRTRFALHFICSHRCLRTARREAKDEPFQTLTSNSSTVVRERTCGMHRFQWSNSVEP